MQCTVQQYSTTLDVGGTRGVPSLCSSMGVQHLAIPWQSRVMHNVHDHSIMFMTVLNVRGTTVLQGVMRMPILV